MHTTVAHKRCYKSPRCSKHPLQIWSALVRRGLLCKHTLAAAHLRAGFSANCSRSGLPSDGSFLI